MNLEKVLPPGVNGKKSGHLTVKVDEVFWSRCSPGEIYVELLWWGERDSTIFRPEDITQNENITKKEYSVTYNIRTSPGLFETYLRNCDKLKFTILRGQKKNVMVGTTVVKDIYEIMTKKEYSSYFPIFSPKGLRIGDLHICFDLNFVLKESHYTEKHKTEEKLHHPKEFRRKPSSSKSSTSASQEDQLLSEILQKGNELRKAMLMSVLADCPVNKIDTVIAEKNSNKTAPLKRQVRKDDAKLVDFLLGKDMTVEEEKQAIETLRCISPEDNLINLAKPENSSTVTKSTCCLHGSQCKKKTNKEQHKSSSAPITSEPLSPPSSNEYNTEDTVENKDEEKNKVEKNYNCYRLIAKTLTLTCDGSRKIYYAPALAEIEETMKSKRVHHPPGTSFILEITLPSKGPLARTLKFTTKDYKDKNVIFGQGTTHRLCGTVTWSRVKSQVSGSIFTVYWRHLNQRVPCPLGTAKLETIDPCLDSDSVSLSLPLYSNTRMLTGHLNLSVNLGTMVRGGGEALFRLKENTNPTNHCVTEVSPTSKGDEGYDFVISEYSSKPPLRSASIKESEPVEIISSDDEIQPELGPGQLDDELVRTINLLNSKPDCGKERSDAYHKSTSVSSRTKSKQEACVQTTLPLINPGCPNCHHSDVTPLTRHSNPDPVTLTNLRVLENKSPPERLERVHNDHHIPSNAESYPQSTKTRSHSMYDDYCHPNERFHHDANLIERLRVAPREYNGTEKIHEYSIKIEKVVGVPLFTGDNDLDCYVDYMFPKVEANGIMTFDRVYMGTEVRIALRETEFGTISRHRLRLSCKLTRALLTLPSTELIFSVWGRAYSPTPQDYRLGKAVLPVSKLSSLEMKYEQQKHRQPISEKCILPLVALDSPLTSGYKGSFGELHIIIGYSNASGLSYREWRCKNKDDHYWCRSHLCNSSSKVAYTEPNYECVRTQTNDHPQNEQSEPLQNGANFRTFDNVNQHMFRADVVNHQWGYPESETHFLGTLKDHNKNNSKYLLQADARNPIKDPQHLRGTNLSSKTIPSNTEHKRIIPDDIVHIPFQDYVTDNRYITGCSNDFQNVGVSHHRNCISKKFFCSTNERMQPVIESNDCVDSFKSNQNLPFNNYLPESTLDMLGFGKRENIVKKVLKDIQERKQREKKLASSVQNSKPNENEITNHEGGEDVFNSFNLRTELPNNDDLSDFEVRSHYSFLKTPESSFPVNNCLDLESPSSSSIKHRLHDKQTLNPFSSQSNISLNSVSSMFQQPDKNNDAGVVHTLTNHQPLGSKVLQEDTPVLVRSLESEISSRKNNITNRKKEENSHCSLPARENSISSNGTLKSVESLKDIVPSETNNNILSNNEMVTILQAPLNKAKFFKARVEICRALGLPSLEMKQLDGRITLVKPTSHAYFSSFVNATETLLRTRVVEKKSNPIWDSSWDVHLPVELLKKSDRELEIFVELSGDGDDIPMRTSDISIHWPIVLRTGVDLTPITAGLQNASGWYSLSDRALMSRAQIKVIVTPLEDISGYRDEWLKEYTKSKGKKRELSRPEMRSSLATSLQEKLYELEKLTQRMKDKMAARSHWDESPPLSLLAEVEEVSVGLHGELPSRVRKKQQIKSTNFVPEKTDETSVIVVSDDSDVVSDDKGSYEVVNTYTLSQGSGDNKVSDNEDSIETSSQAIDRIITKVRENR